MPLTKEQAQQVKQQLISQINSTFPEDKKSQAIEQVNNMSNQQLEEIVKQSQQQSQQSSSDTNKEQVISEKNSQCIFCSIVSGKIPTYKFAEDENSIAVLEINPIQKGHVLVIPKEHITNPEELPKKTQSLTSAVSEKMQEILQPKKIQLATTNITGHEIINLVPNYSNTEIDLSKAERKKANESELKELQEKLKIEPISSETSQSPSQKSKQQEQSTCPFCQISQGQVQSYQIDDNKSAMAVLEINPISRGHSIIIPKKHISNSKDMPNQAFTLGKKIAKKLQNKFKPKDILVASGNIQGHEIINVLPVYQDENLNSERKKAEPQELEKLQKLLKKKPRKKSSKSQKGKRKTKKKSKKSSVDDITIPKRIP